MYYSPDAEYIITNPARQLSQDPAFKLAVLYVLHVPLALLLLRYSTLATFHALLVLAIGLWFLKHDQTPTRLVYVAGYIASSEVLWRAAGANVFWEFGKYAIVLLLGLAILKWRFRLHILPVFYFATLVPAIFLILDTPGARGAISFNLSGHLLIAVASLFFLSVQINRQHIKNLILVMLMPISSIAVRSLYTTTTATQVVFDLTSNFVTSGGFGPNQVSAILGLGTLLCWVYLLLTTNETGKIRWLIFALGIGFLVQGILTFSRGGVFNILIAAPIATFYLMSKQQRARQTAIVALILLGLAAYFILPRLVAFTGGAVEQRFTNLNTTGRFELFQADLEIWKTNWLWGVGPGQADEERALFYGRSVAAHTEYSRLLSEHGLLGIFAMLVLGIMVIIALRRARSPWAKGIIFAFMLWSLAEMTHAAMRLAVISYLFALPLANFVETDE